MTDPRQQGPDLEARLRELADTTRTHPDPGFAARLRDRFLRHPDRARPRLPLGRIVVAAAAAIAAVAFAVRQNAGPDWGLLSRPATGWIRIGGQTIAADDSARLANALRPGAEVAVPDSSQLDLVLPGAAVLQIAGGSRAILPSRPGRWFPRVIAASLLEGELRISTGPAFRGVRLVVGTPEARAVVTGTTLSVLRFADSTCVCVFEGRVVMAQGTATDTVLGGTRRSVFRHGGPPRLEPIRPMETMKLSMLRDRAARALGPPGSQGQPPAR